MPQHIGTRTCHFLDIKQPFHDINLIKRPLCNLLKIGKNSLIELGLKW